MLSIQELQPLIDQPREDLGAEYKDWLDTGKKEHKAQFAKAAIAMANHGGGFIAIGFSENEGRLTSHLQPDQMPKITQDSINGIVARYCSPAFHCQLDYVENRDTNVCHIVIAVPGNLAVPVMSKRDQQGVIAANRCYVRKPGPCSEEPNSSDEWRSLFDRCIRARRSEMIDAIRVILHGHVEDNNPSRDALDGMKTFCETAYQRWLSLIDGEPLNSPARLSKGYYEMGFSLVGAPPLAKLDDLRTRLREAGKISLTGWPPFLDLVGTDLTSKVVDDYVEAWLGRPIANRTSSWCDFWRASLEGKLYIIRGYTEDVIGVNYTDSTGKIVGPGEVIDLTYPVRRVAEELLFVERFAATFNEVDEIVIRTRFTGLKNRCLISLTKSRGYHEDKISATDEVVLEARATPQQVRNNIVEVVYGLLAPLYEKFNFHQLSTQLVSEEIEDMQKRRG